MTTKTMKTLKNKYSDLIAAPVSAESLGMLVISSCSRNGEQTSDEMIRVELEYWDEVWLGGQLFTAYDIELRRVFIVAQPR